jgi:hypothetical protein
LASRGGVGIDEPVVAAGSSIGSPAHSRLT